jgi:hypothetical protein
MRRTLLARGRKVAIEASKNQGAVVKNRSLLLVGLLSTVSALSLGCTHIATYDRAQLAHPSMTRANLDGPGAEHVYSVHEGAIGGGSVAESGCGCN